MKTGRRLAVTLLAAALLGGPLMPAASADDTNPPQGDEETLVTTASDPAAAGHAGSALLEVILNCMKKQGEVPASAQSSVVLGDYTPSTGASAPPTGTAVQPSEFCATNSVITTEKTISASSNLSISYVLADLKALQQNAESGRDVMPVDGWSTGGTGTGGGTTTKTLGAAAASNSTTAPQMALAAATTSDRRYWTNRRGLVNSNSAFMSYRYSPSYMNWTTDECSAPVAGNGPYGFRNSCIRHDFNYRNLKGLSAFSRNNKARADTKFESDMFIRCANAYSGGTRTKCVALAMTYGGGVRALQWPNTTGYKLGGSYTW